MLFRKTLAPLCVCFLFFGSSKGAAECREWLKILTRPSEINELELAKLTIRESLIGFAHRTTSGERQITVDKGTLTAIYNHEVVGSVSFEVPRATYVEDEPIIYLKELRLKGAPPIRLQIAHQLLRRLAINNDPSIITTNVENYKANYDWTLSPEEALEDKENYSPSLKFLLKAGFEIYGTATISNGVDSVAEVQAVLNLKKLDKLMARAIRKVREAKAQAAAPAEPQKVLASIRNHDDLMNFLIDQGQLIQSNQPPTVTRALIAIEGQASEKAVKSLENLGYVKTDLVPSTSRNYWILEYP